MESKCGYGDDDGGKGDKEIKENPITARFRNEMKRDGCFFARQLLKLTIIVFFGRYDFFTALGKRKERKSLYGCFSGINSSFDCSLLKSHQRF